MGQNNSQSAILQPTSQLNPNMTTTVTNTSAKISPDLPKGPANFTSFQLPGSTSNSLNINVATLQQCMSENLNSTALNNCISNNISSYDSQAASYQNVNYVGPGHNIDAAGNIAFGPFNSTPQTFANIEQESFTNTKISVYVIIVLLYLYIMLKK